MKVNSKLLILAITFCLVFSFAAQAYAATDISGHWARETIEQCLSKGIVAGMPDGTFQPNKNVTRAEFATMVNKAFGFKDADTDKKFSDIKDSDWYAEQVAIAAKTGYITGMPDGTFQPQRQCTRAEACVMIRRAAGMEEGKESALSVFKDMGSIPAFARGCVSALVSEGLIKGYPDGTFGPQAQITRAESLVMIYRTSTGDFEEPDEKVSVTGVELDRDTISISEGSTRKLKATVKPADATNKEVKWSTSDEEIATVDDDGLVKGIKVGKATITVTTKDGNKTATCKVEVTRRSSGGGGGGVSGSIVKVTDISVDSEAMILEVGKTGEIKATIEPSNATNKKVNWTTSDANVATVDASGKVTAVGVGEATIIATSDADSSKKASRVVMVIFDEAIHDVQPVDDPLGNTVVKVFIKDAFVSVVTKVTVNGKEANKISANEYRVIVDGKKTVGDLDIKVIKSGDTTVDKATLIAAITAAKEKVAAATVGNDPGQYPQDAVDAYNDAIADAQAVVDNNAATQADVDAALTTLNRATEAFKAAKVPVPGDAVIKMTKAILGPFGEINFSVTLQSGVTARSVKVDGQPMEEIRSDLYRLKIVEHAYNLGETVIFTVVTDEGVTVESEQQVSLY